MDGHLISGAPTSQILSYLANHRMFDEIADLAHNNSIILSIYVDDITFSSHSKIPDSFKRKARSIIKKYGYRLSRNKNASYGINDVKKVTGVIIDKNNKYKIPNSLSQKIHDEKLVYMKNPETNCQRLLGLIESARQIEPGYCDGLYRKINQDMARIREKQIGS